MRRFVLSVVLIALAFTASPVPARDRPDVATPTRMPTAHAVDAQWIGPWATGSYFAPSRSGEGIILQFLADGTAIAFWFTYPLAGEPGEQAWLIAQGSSTNGNRLVFSDVYRPSGARFGDAFDPNAVDLDRWGTLELSFADCNTVTLSWAGPAAFGSGQRTLTRLSALDELDCNATSRRLTSTGARAPEGLRAKSGAFFVPARAGEGWIVEELADGRGVVYWFTYDLQGRQAWLFGIAQRNGETYDVTSTLQPRGTRWGDAFDASSVELRPWGRMTLAFNSCDALTVTYASTVDGYGSGTRNATRLTTLGSAPCIATRKPPQDGAWTERATLPAEPQSDFAAVAVGDTIYALGGFGDPRGFKRYDAASDSWTELPDLPAGRDHPSAFHFDGGIYYTGGANLGGGAQETRGFRYDIAASRWDPVPELPPTFGNQAAVLNGRAYLGDGTGQLFEYDPRRRVGRTIAPPNSRERNQAVFVPFAGEIWVIGGRAPETNTVAIYDPVTERWRFGPPMRRAHAGFAAAVAGDQIFVAGGEYLFLQPVRIEPSFEVYTAGQAAWREQGNLPRPVHGLAGATIGNRFYAISGASAANSANGVDGRMWSWEFRP